MQKNEFLYATPKSHLELFVGSLTLFYHIFQVSSYHSVIGQLCDSFLLADLLINFYIDY